ncbi:DNA polymerase III subunit alpha [Leucobacter komagatae]|uniref:Error-prone DNA polymerase n=1 Tax=Leucobacter komagatae TaxID=55969 RepID=A0A0D0IWL0_9MICO|nr:DNA polymerase III subunit alpha [Leucobacter komagatae]
MHAHSHYSFLDGSSSPEQLVTEARRLGLAGLALTDHDGFYGAPRFAEAALSAPEFLTVYGAELTLGLDAPQLGAADPAGTHLLALARGATGYHRLAAAITEAQLAGGEKGRPVYDIEELAAAADGDWVILTGCRKGAVRRALERDAHGGDAATLSAAASGWQGGGLLGYGAASAELDRLTALFGKDNVFVELTHHGHPGDDARNELLATLAGDAGLPTLATGAIHAATRPETRTAEAMSAIRARRSLAELDPHLQASGASYLRSPKAMLRHFASFPGAVARTVPLARELAFPLREATPRLPKLDLPAGHTQMSWLRQLVWDGARERYGAGPETLDGPRRERIERELDVIEQLDFPGYFLIVHDIVREARARGILCQGRGSAANSAVCYLLKVTSVDSIFYGLPFERFLSSLREEEPDIDVDFDSERREEIIQYVYEKYGRRNAAQVANVITYRPKAAIRDAAKALGYSPAEQRAWTGSISHHDDFPEAAGPAGSGTMPAASDAAQGGSTAGGNALDAHASGDALGAHAGAAHGQGAPPEPAPVHKSGNARDSGRARAKSRGRAGKPGNTPSDDPGSPYAAIPEPVLRLAGELKGAPRHLGIHSGGMVLTERPVGEVCPIEHARMDGRTVLQWDKDDCAAMRLVKFDLLGLGMLSAIDKTLRMVAAATGEEWTFDSIPKEEAGVYDMLCRGDAIGVFQVESRAQLNTLPRLRPRCFYDLVIEIALIRPGPIQGGAVHPYLRRRAGKEEITYSHPSLEPVLARTLGIPLFQEQLMQIATTVGGCTGEDADLLRRSMGSKRGKERMDSLREKIFAGMRENGIEGEQAQLVYTQLESFADFGFAESHSISFALIVYVSSWLKLHYPAVFLAGLLQSQPMGFYSARSLAEDAKRHGVEVLPPDVQFSAVHAGVETSGGNAAHAADQHAHPASPTGIPACAARTHPPVGPFDETAPDTSGKHRRDGRFAVRLGLAEVRGIGERVAERIVAARAAGPFADLADLARRADLDREQLEALASSGACTGLGMSRREALWGAGPASENRDRFLPGIAVHVQPPLLPLLTDAEQTSLDLWTTGVATGTHPLALLREQLDARRIARSDLARNSPNGSTIEVAGLVTHRQRPGTAAGVTFLTLEDESGTVNIVVWAKVWQTHRFVAQSSPALIVRGVADRSPEGVFNVIAHGFEPLPAPQAIASRDFR